MSNGRGNPRCNEFNALVLESSTFIRLAKTRSAKSEKNQLQVFQDPKFDGTSSQLTDEISISLQ